jgi:hypothetical protein
MAFPPKPADGGIFDPPKKKPAPKADKSTPPFETMDPLGESEDDMGDGEHKEFHTLLDILKQVASGDMSPEAAESEVREIISNE